MSWRLFWQIALLVVIFTSLDWGHYWLVERPKEQRSQQAAIASAERASTDAVIAEVRARAERTVRDEELNRLANSATENADALAPSSDDGGEPDYDPMLDQIRARDEAQARIAGARPPPTAPETPSVGNEVGNASSNAFQPKT